MQRVSSLDLDLHPNLLDAFAKLFPTVDAYLSSLELLTVPEDTTNRDFTRKAETALEDFVRDQIAPPPISATQLFSNVQHKSRILPSGCESLDALLLGGLREGQITELVGNSACGKTQICMQFTAASACRGESVLYIDTASSFSASRLRNLCASELARSQAKLTLEGALKRICTYSCHEVHDLLLKLNELDSHCQSLLERNAEFERVHILVIDSVASLISPILGGAPGHRGHNLMVQLAAGLKQLAAAYDIAILITNPTVTDRNGVSRPGLGESWRNQPHTRVLLNRPEGEPSPTKLRASLMSSPLTALGQAAFFQIGANAVTSAT